jgi:hypothetical protein
VRYKASTNNRIVKSLCCDAIFRRVEVIVFVC